MNKENPFELPLTVRGYELDAFHHVNNAVYVQYFEHARWMALKDLGPQWLQGQGLTMVVRKLTVEYDAPATVFDELVVRLWVERIGTSSVTFGQDLLRGEKTLARAQVVAVCLGTDGRPHPVPEQWKEIVGWTDEKAPLSD